VCFFVFWCIFAGGFIGSAIFGGGADILGVRQGPATEASHDAELAVKKLQTELVRNGFSNMKKVSKLLSEAESLVKQASWYDTETKKFVLPENLATIFEDAKTVKYNPKTIEAVKLGEKYKGVTAGKVDFEVKDYAEVSANNKMSVAYTVDNQPVVVVDKDILHGKKKSEWEKTVREYMKKYSPYIPVNGQSIKFTTTSRNEFTHSEYTQILEDTDDLKYKDKLMFGGNLDEVLSASSDYVNEKPNHERDDDIVGFGRGKILLKIGKRGYSADVLVAISKNGSAKFHDLVSMEPVSLQIKKEGHKDARIGESYRNGRPASDNILSQQNPIVNAKSAISHKTQLALNALAKFTGVNVGFANNVTDADGRAVDGVYDSASKQITLSLNSQKPLLFTAVHESMHHLKSYNPQLYAFLSGNIFSMYKNNPQAFDVLFGEVGARYASDIAGLSKNTQVDYLSEELMSDLMAEVMCSSKGLSALARIDRNAFQRMYDSVISVFDYMTGRYENLATEHSVEMQDAIDVILEEKKAFIDMYARGVEGYAEVGWSETSTRAGDAPVLFSREVPFNKQVDEVLKPASDFKQYVHVGQTSNLLYKCGFGDLPVLMTPGHIRDINTDKSKNKPGESRYHGLTPDQIKHIPDMLKNPVMIYDSISPDNHENTVCVLSDEFDSDGLPIIVVFKYVEGIPDTRVPSHCIVETKNYNMVASQYGRNGFYNHLLEIIDKDAVLYVNKPRMEKFLNKKTLNLSTGNKVQFLESFDKLGFDKIIHQSRNLVKYKDLTKTTFSRRSDEGSYELSDVQLGIIADITRRAAEKYGIRELSQEEMKGVSLKQSDIDARLRRQFRFDDVNQPTVFKDTNHNSLHLSDAVIFTSGEGANVNYGTGRILGFDNSGNVTIAVDSGAYGSQVTVPQSKVTFVAHNNAETVSRDYTSANLSYERAKTAFDNFGKSGDVRALGTFGFNEAQHYLFDSSEKLFALSKMMSLHNDGTDYGTGIGASRNNDAEWGEFDSFDYSSMSYRDLLLQYYDAVRNTNLAKDVSDLYIALGKETLDIEQMVRNLKDIDSLNPFRKGNLEKKTQKNTQTLFLQFACF